MSAVNSVNSRGGWQPSSVCNDPAEVFRVAEPLLQTDRRLVLMDDLMEDLLYSRRNLEIDALNCLRILAHLHLTCPWLCRDTRPRASGTYNSIQRNPNNPVKCD